MNFWSNIFVIFCAINELNSTEINSNSLDFCNTFIQNGNRFDYGYQQNETNFYYLFIGHHYWRLLVNGSAQSVQLIPDSKYSPWFGNQFEFAIRGDFNVQETNGTLTGLVNADYEVLWKQVLADPDTGDLTLPQNYTFTTNGIPFENGFEPSVGFDYGVFIQQIPNNSSPPEYVRSFRSFNFDPDSFEASIDTEFIQKTKNKMDQYNITYGTDDTIIDNIRDRYEAVAAFTTSEGLFFLLKDNQTILYCFSYKFLAILGCHTQPQTLIDCSA